MTSSVLTSPVATITGSRPTLHNSPASVQLRNLTAVFGSNQVVKGIDLDIAGGEFFSLLGPSGCGKTTTLRMIAGLEQAAAGSILIDGSPVQQLPAHKRPVHTVFQNYALFPHLTVAENVAFGLKERREPRKAIEERVAAMLEIVELDGKGHLRPRELSGGMQQRVALARSLVLGPRVLLLDEPLGALDLRMRRAMQVFLKQVQHQLAITFVYVTHDQEEAFAMSDRVGLMNDGQLEQVGAPTEIYRRPATRFAAGFVGESNTLTAQATAAEEGRYHLEIDGVGSGYVAGAPGESGTVTAILRPESVSLGDGDRDGDDDFAVTGMVQDVAFLGARTSVRVGIPGDTVLIADLPSHLLPEGIRVGASTRAFWSARDVWAVNR
ncbi:ABC transporter ATP-binding protein [Glaciibacter sp. 2TAF33]|uniref:ABC transporter ATP-binding protein n=1 Tax=Glaciibacter sp. 2TAF33 TaxID=3233015 RepID=UPI003F92E813